MYVIKVCHKSKVYSYFNFTGPQKFLTELGNSPNTEQFGEICYNILTLKCAHNANKNIIYVKQKPPPNVAQHKKHNI